MMSAPCPVAPDTQRGSGDDLSHVVCLVCYPGGAHTLPIQCVCGKIISQRPGTNIRCVVCSGMIDPHIKDHLNRGDL